MGHREFAIEPSKADPPTFSVAGRSFKCLAEPPAGVLTDILTAIGGDVPVQAQGIVNFVTGCLTDADAEAFELLIHDKDTVVPLVTLGAVVEFLIEEYNGRPTTPSSVSAGGSTPTPDTSEDGADSAESNSTALGSSD